MKQPEAILFDADGTLYESEHLNFEVNRLTAAELYNFELTWEDYDEHIRRGTIKAPDLIRLNGIDVVQDTYLARRLEHFERISREMLVPMPGVVDFLGWCKQVEIKCVVVSAARRDYIGTSLKILGMSNYFQDIVGMEDVENRKPHPDPYRLGLKIVDVVASNALAIEDTHKGITSAKAAGLRCVGIINDANSPVELVEAEVIIKSYDELIDLFESPAKS